MNLGYVAQLDILGFSELVMSDQSKDAIAAYQDTLSKAVANTGGVQYVIFSDSIILTIEGGGIESLLAMCRACSILMYELLLRHIPVRGAVSFGPYVRTNFNSSNVFVAGGPIVDAYRYEQVQKWIGVMLTPTLVKKDIKILADEGENGHSTFVEGGIQKCQVIPVADAVGGIYNYEGYAIVPYTFSETRNAIVDLRELVPHLTQMRTFAPSPVEQAKCTRTIDWLQSFIDAADGDGPYE